MKQMRRGPNFTGMLGLLCGLLIVVGYTNCGEPTGYADSGAISAETDGVPDVVSASTGNRNHDNQTIGINSTSSSTSNDQSALQTLIDRIDPALNPVNEIQLEPRDYVLNCPSDTVPAPPCLRVVNKGRLRIVGQAGRTRILLSNPRTGFLFVNGMEEFKLENVTIDYTTPPFLQARVTQVGTSQFRIRVDSGYLDFSHPALATDLFRSRAAFFWVVNSSTGMMRNAIAHHIPLDIRGRYPTRDPATGEWIVRVPPGVPNLSTELAIGDYCLLGSRIDEGVGLLFDKNSNVELRNVTLHSGPHMGVFVYGNSQSFVADGIKIVPKPGSGRLASVAADAMHLLDNRGRIQISNSVIEGMGDDAVNIQSYAANVGSLQALGSNELRVRPSFFGTPYRVGDVIQVVGANNLVPRFGPQNEPRIVQILPDGIYWRLVLDRPRHVSVVENDFVYNIQLAAPGAIVSNNYFGPFRGGFRIRSPSAVFSNNQFEDLRNNNILTSVDAGFPTEGPITGLAINSNNRLALLPPANAFNRVGVFRFYEPARGRHHLTLRSNNPALSFEGEAFQLGAVQTSSNRALYSCYMSQGTQFLSHNASCEGLGGAKLLGFINIQTSTEAPRALYRCYKPQVGHFTTVNRIECVNNGYTVEGTMGFVP